MPVEAERVVAATASVWVDGRRARVGGAGRPPFSSLNVW